MTPAAPLTPIRVLLVDDQSLVRAGLAMLLSAEPDVVVVGESSDGADAVARSATLRPDVVVMDVRMPGMDGVTATRALVEEADDDADHLVRVLILTTFRADDVVYGALRAGASGFLLKDAAPTDLAAAVRRVASGEAWLDPPIAARLLSDFAARPDQHIPPPEELHRLTRREREILIQVAHGLSNQDIARHLVVGEATVKTHLGRVLMKLGLRDRAQAVAVAYKTGLVKPDDVLP